MDLHRALIQLDDRVVWSRQGGSAARRSWLLPLAFMPGVLAATHEFPALSLIVGLGFSLMCAAGWFVSRTAADRRPVTGPTRPRGSQS